MDLPLGCGFCDTFQGMTRVLQWYMYEGGGLVHVGRLQRAVSELSVYLLHRGRLISVAIVSTGRLVWFAACMVERMTFQTACPSRKQ